jgi:hypothetical protein
MGVSCLLCCGRDELLIKLCQESVNLPLFATTHASKKVVRQSSLKWEECAYLGSVSKA